MNDSIRVGQGTLPTMQNTCIKIKFSRIFFFWGVKNLQYEIGWLQVVNMGN